MGPVTKNVKSGSIITAGGNDCSLIEKFDLCVVLGLKSQAYESVVVPGVRSERFVL